MAPWAIAVTIIGALAFVGLLVGLNIWQENKHTNKKWWLNKNE